MERSLRDQISELLRVYVEQEISAVAFEESSSHKVLDQKTGNYRESNAAENLAFRQDDVADEVMSNLRDALINGGKIVADRLGDPGLAIDLIMREAQTIQDLEGEGFLHDSLGLPREDST